MKALPKEVDTRGTHNSMNAGTEQEMRIRNMEEAFKRSIQGKSLPWRSP
jgi:hypothetical protein